MSQPDFYPLFLSSSVTIILTLFWYFHYKWKCSKTIYVIDNMSLNFVEWYMRYLSCNASVLEVGPMDGVGVVHSWHGCVVSHLQLSHSAGSPGSLPHPRSLLGLCTLLFGRYQEVEVSGWRTPQPSAVLVTWIPTLCWYQASVLLRLVSNAIFTCSFDYQWGWTFLCVFWPLEFPPLEQLTHIHCSFFPWGCSSFTGFWGIVYSGN